MLYEVITRCAVARAIIEPGIGESLGQLVLHTRRIAEPVEGDAVFALIHRSGCQQSCAPGDILRHDHRRSELESFGQAIGLVADHARRDEVHCANLEAVADLDSQPVDRTLRQPCLISYNFV